MLLGTALRIGGLHSEMRQADPILRTHEHHRGRHVREREALRDFATGLGPLGSPSKVEQTAQRDRGGMTFRGYDVTFASGKVEIWERDMPNGKIEQFQVMPKK